MLKNEKPKFPYKTVKLDCSQDPERLKYVKGYIQVGPKKYLLPGKYMEEAHIYYNLEVRPNDVFLVGFPRSGTTMLRELIWLLKNNLDFKKASESILAHRFPYLERGVTFNEEAYDKTDGNEKKPNPVLLPKPNWQKLQEMEPTETRLIKTHLPLSLLPPNLLEVGCKVVYIARNPKDVIVSYFHLLDLFNYKGYDLNFEQHWRNFRENKVPLTPLLEHVKEAWVAKNNDNLLFVFYENLNKAFPATVTKIATFLGTSLSATDVETLQNHFNIENFRKNNSVNNQYLMAAGILNPNTDHGFIRKGKVGNWKEYFNDELNAEADEWIQKNLENTDLSFLD